ncbi:unnamed protein product [Rotaria magnacalcarata]|uniref:Uncharacterized protein n=1 Tax=Rotaria magnacalcarata TaxID=392030 RepID=A0A8S2QNA9_9BILA|nr:unnamed protein product [Rotaria magnacalcarata]CAF4108866.1 unnamed protein product [Rotaria magnacalcarata]
MQVFALFFFLHLHIIVLSTKTEIKFNVNVPSLFRCKPNGRVFYFHDFPTNQIFNQTIRNYISDCDLSLMTPEKRVIFDIDQLISRCTDPWYSKEDRINEILVFKTNCSVNDQCIRLTPSVATIIKNHRTKSNQPTLLDFDIRGIGTEKIQIGEDDQYPISYRDDGYTKRGFKKSQIVFKIQQDTYLNMMCEYTYINNPDDSKSICRVQYLFYKNLFHIRSGKMTSSGAGWSWLCYYYPSNTEDPMDITIISKAISDSEKASSSDSRLSPELDQMNPMDSFDNSSMPLNPKNNNSFVRIFILLLIFIAIVGLFCLCKKQNQVVLEEESDDFDRRRSSVESQNSIKSN